jgi:hypothetical protein
MHAFLKAVEPNLPLITTLFLCIGILANTWSIHSVARTLRIHNHTLSIILEALRHGAKAEITDAESDHSHGG